MGLNQSIESQNEIVDQTIEKNTNKDNFERKIII
jgi:hypothetical protein